MKAGVPRETYPDERRVALVPGVLAPLAKAGIETLVEAGAGERAGFSDDAYRDKGAQVVSRADVFSQADVILQVRGLGTNPDAGRADLPMLRRGQTVIALLDPLASPDTAGELAGTGVTAFSMELMPRITRAQSMDVLSSQANIAGYKAVLIAAEHLPRMFPMMMTAAGTMAPARVFVLGAGVAGLQAIATAKRLGALVEAYDVRAAVKEQVESVGAKFVELPLDTAAAEGTGGYAAAQDESFLRRQRETLTRVVAGADVVITTAAIPGKKSPMLITRDMVEGMQRGSVIVDLAAERGGNCEVTRPDQMVEVNGVTVLGPTNLAGTVPYHASQMYAKNITTFLLHLVKDGQLRVDPEDEITRETLVTKDGEIVHERVRAPQ
jgi:H+-translocating NAD(P) transhydrogenase subunit alpha